MQHGQIKTKVELWAHFAQKYPKIFLKSKHYFPENGVSLKKGLRFFS